MKRNFDNSEELVIDGTPKLDNKWHLIHFEYLGFAHWKHHSYGRLEMRPYLNVIFFAIGSEADDKAARFAKANTCTANVEDHIQN